MIKYCVPKIHRKRGYIYESIELGIITNIDWFTTVYMGFYEALQPWRWSICDR